MEARVKSDDTDRTIVIEVSGIPDVDLTGSWHKKPRIFRPDQVTLTLADGVLSGISVSGPLVLKSGGVSDSVRENQRWSPRPELPAWLRLLVQQAPAGVTSWNEPEAQTL